VDEHTEQTSAEAPSRDYSEVGGHIASILNAAEQAAAEIRADAAREAEALRLAAASEAETLGTTTRRQAEEEAERLVAGAKADARALRDTARAAAERIAEEGGRRLEELRLEARALEGRFERVVDDVRDLIAQLEHVVVNSVDAPAADDEAGVPVLAAAPELREDLWPRLAEVPRDDADADAAPADARDGARFTSL
jgi:DNA anti-recombination protein RmuC